MTNQEQSGSRPKHKRYLSARYMRELLLLVDAEPGISLAELGRQTLARKIHIPRKPGISLRKTMNSLHVSMQKPLHLGLVTKQYVMVGSYWIVQYRITDLGRRWLAEVEPREDA